MNFRSRALLDLAAHQDCTFRVPGICVGGPCVSCHSNALEDGKGAGIKAHDCFVAWGCAACHRWYDTGPAPREEKRLAFTRAMRATLLAMWEQGMIGVTHKIAGEAAAATIKILKPSRTTTSPKIIPHRGVPV